MRPAEQSSDDAPASIAIRAPDARFFLASGCLTHPQRAQRDRLAVPAAPPLRDPSVVSDPGVIVALCRRAVAGLHVVQGGGLLAEKQRNALMTLERL